MPLANPQKAAMVALWNAKSTFSVLSILRDSFGNDLNLAKVAFTIALRTRPDFFNEPEEKFFEIVGDTHYFTSKNLSATIYEVSKYSGIDRASVRRKLNKLVELGYVEKTSSGQWSLVNFLKDDDGLPAQTIKRIFQSYLHQITELLTILSIDDIKKIKKSSHASQILRSDALNSTEVAEKIAKLNLNER